jgi:hypothetical protein
MLFMIISLNTKNKTETNAKLTTEKWNINSLNCPWKRKLIADDVIINFCKTKDCTKRTCLWNLHVDHSSVIFYCIGMTFAHRTVINVSHKKKKTFMTEIFEEIKTKILSGLN